FDGVASRVVVELAEQAAARLLRRRAEAAIDDPEVLPALLGLLEQRRRWPEILSLLARAAELGLAPADRAETWLTIADAARADDDVGSEARARERAGELLGREAGLFDPGELDEQLASQAIGELVRALELAPDHAA